MTALSTELPAEEREFCFVGRELRVVALLQPLLGYFLLLRWSISANQRLSAVQFFALKAFSPVEIVCADSGRTFRRARSGAGGLTQHPCRQSGSLQSRPAARTDWRNAP